jgi:predicted enzyme related to lactoylglutathione lyase
VKSKASGAKRPEFEKVAFTLFPITDPTRARAFYEDVLGLERGLASPDGTWTEYDLPGGGCLALFKHPNPEMAPPPGGGNIAFEVADLDVLNERLQAAGVEYRGGMIKGPNCRMSNIVDSEGNAIILHQLDEKPAPGAKKPAGTTKKAAGGAKKAAGGAKKPTRAGSRRPAARGRR